VTWVATSIDVGELTCPTNDDSTLPWGPRPLQGSGRFAGALSRGSALGVGHRRRVRRSGAFCEGVPSPESCASTVSCHAGCSSLKTARTIRPPDGARIQKEREAAGRGLGLDLQILEARDPITFEKVLTSPAMEGAGALMVQTNPLFITHRQRIVERVAKSRVPAGYGERSSWMPEV
jgi:hypothetical protein